MPTPEEQIKQVQEKVLYFETSQLSLSEAETRRALIDPVFAAIGWDMGNPIVVRMEWRRNPDDRPVDYAFMINGVPRLLVEAERLRENITGKKWEDQLLWYSSKLGVKWCALTNGNIIRIYNSLAEEAAADKLLFEMEIRTIDTLAGLPIDAFMARLYLLSEGSLREGKIDEVWGDIYAIRKVFDYLKTERDSLVDGIVRSAKLTKKSVGEVLDRLIGLRESFLDSQEDTIDNAPSDYKPLFDVTGKPISYAGRGISSFWFSGSIYAADSWRDLLLKVSSIIGERHEDEFHEILEVKGTRRPYYTRYEDQLKAPREIPDTGVFVETNLSSHNIGVILGKVLEKFGYGKEDVKIRLI